LLAFKLPDMLIELLNKKDWVLHSETKETKIKVTIFFLKFIDSNIRKRTSMFEVNSDNSCVDGKY